MGLIDKIFGTYSERQLKKLRVIADAIEALADKYKNMTNEELSATTVRLKERLAAGETLDDILPDAFAAVREADERVLGKRPFYVQILGGIILHQGRIAEMKTGEGKTLVATMPAYLNALTGLGVHIVTANDYLARRDSEEMGRVYQFMGLDTGLVTPRQGLAEKREAYAADITYGTNNEFGFDYLRDNMAKVKEQTCQRGHIFAIVDEVDSILVDEARTPLIISGEGEKATDMYEHADRFVRSLKKRVIKEQDTKLPLDQETVDYIVDEKANNAIITPLGAAKAETYFSLENYNDPQNTELVHHINQALRAHGTMHRDIDYVVNQDGVVIVDAFTGRLMPGRRYSNGLHQAIEAKERVTVRKENKTIATITIQNYFRMYKKLSGMTGTAKTEETEFREIYGLDVVEVPTNRPMIRIDHPDVLFKTTNSKYNAIVAQVAECHKKGQPILVGTVSIEKSEELSAKFKKHGIPHTVLNAKQHEKEAEIIAQAGKLGAVTISTNMAGRGTDIMLGGNPEYMAKQEMRKMGIDEELIAMATGTVEIDDQAIIEARNTFRELYSKFKEKIAPEAEAVKAAGGLFILGTERHESRRIDNQLRGRSGRQGDPGESRFYLSFEDELLRLFMRDRFSGIISRVDDDMALDFNVFSSSIETAQKHIEDNNFKRRKNVLSYDDVMNLQRSTIYAQRKEVLDGEDISEKIKNMIIATISMDVERFTAAENPRDWSFDALQAKYKGLLRLDSSFDFSPENEEMTDRVAIRDTLCDKALEIYAEKEERFGKETFRAIERRLLLNAVDAGWMEHIDMMDDLKTSVGLHAYAQRDPVNEYRLESAEMFDAMVSDIRENTVRAVLSVELQKAPAPVIKVVSRPSAAKKISPNSLCPCGSGKKYKQCCQGKQ